MTVTKVTRLSGKALEILAEYDSNPSEAIKKMKKELCSERFTKFSLDDGTIDKIVTKVTSSHGSVSCKFDADLVADAVADKIEERMRR